MRSLDRRARKVTSIVGAGLFAACASPAGAPAPHDVASFDTPSWSRLYGTYEFEGFVRGNGTVSVVGSVTLREGRYFAKTSHGNCDGRLPLAPSRRIRLACPEITVELTREGDGFEDQGRVYLKLREMEMEQRCPRCEEKPGSAETVLDGPIRVRRVNGTEPKR